MPPTAHRHIPLNRLVEGFSLEYNAFEESNCRIDDVDIFVVSPERLNGHIITIGHEFVKFLSFLVLFDERDGTGDSSGKGRVETCCLVVLVLVVEDGMVVITITVCMKGGRVAVLQHDQIR